MRKCTVVAGDKVFTLVYRDFLFELVNELERNAGVSVRKITWNGGDKYLAFLVGGDILPVSIHGDRKMREKRG